MKASKVLVKAVCHLEVRQVITMVVMACKTVLSSRASSSRDEVALVILVSPGIGSSINPSRLSCSNQLQ